jgi:hypothetical protein
MQSHEKFKIFRGPSVKGQFDALFAQLEAFANQPNHSAKSIGVEYLESNKELIITLGYTDVQGQGNNVKLEVKKIGALSQSNEALESSIQSTAHALKNVICHALYITENDDMNMIFMYDI